MSANIDDLTVAYTEDGIETVKELDKIILSKGAWSTIMFRYQSWESKKQDYSPDRYTIRRYQKRGGEYVLKSRFNISSQEQAKKIIAALQQWMAE